MYVLCISCLIVSLKVSMRVVLFSNLVWENENWIHTLESKYPSPLGKMLKFFLIDEFLYFQGSCAFCFPNISYSKSRVTRKRKEGESIIGLNVENVGTNICIYHKKPLGWMNFYEHFSWFKFQIKSVCKIILAYY